MASPTALELEIGTADVDAWYQRRVGSTLINYGVSVRHPPSAHGGHARSGRLLPDGDAAHKPASDVEIEEIQSATSMMACAAVL